MRTTADENSEFSNVRGKAFTQHTKSDSVQQRCCMQLGWKLHFCLACPHIAEFAYLCRLVHVESSLAFVAYFKILIGYPSNDRLCCALSCHVTRWGQPRQHDGMQKWCTMECTIQLLVHQLHVAYIFGQLHCMTASSHVMLCHHDAWLTHWKSKGTVQSTKYSTDTILNCS